ncbi:MAG: DNA-binding protein HU-beta [Paracoccaceae bacterium]|jgi:DNA-binding protein HU-beta
MTAVEINLWDKIMTTFSFKTAIAAGLTAAAIAVSAAPASAMNEQELATQIAKDAGVSKAVASKMLESYAKNVGAALKKGDRVSIVGFGSFSVSARAARTGRNPQTGKPITIPASKRVLFKADRTLNKIVK